MKVVGHGDDDRADGGLGEQLLQRVEAADALAACGLNARWVDVVYTGQVKFLRQPGL